MTRNGGRVLQHVRRLQDPDNPWHLQWVCKRFFTICAENLDELSIIFHKTQKKNPRRENHVKFTLRPARLLCKFIKLRASPSISRASKNFRTNFIPKLISAEQPPHFHSGCFSCCCCCCCDCAIDVCKWMGNWCWWLESHPQTDIFPRAQDAAIVCTAAALTIAYVNAASREPYKQINEKWKKKKETAKKTFFINRTDRIQFYSLFIFLFISFHYFF